MKVTPIKTHKITTKDTNVLDVIDRYVTTLSNKSILVITSKIIAILQGRVVLMRGTDKDALIEQESQFYLPRSDNPYNVSLTITRNTLIASSGIDESNGDGYYVLRPEDLQNVTNQIRTFLKKKFGLTHVGVLVTDSKTTPMRWGVTALALSYSGFIPLKNYIDTPDIFGNFLHYTKMSIIDNLACASALVMGEGSEQQPLAVVSDVPFVNFVDRNPTKKELSSLIISREEDIYSPLLKNVKWKKGEKD